MNNICQSCLINSVEIIFDQDDPQQPYLLCQACLHRLVHFSLRPREWFNLASIHGYWKYHLHDDFYDDHGNAFQAEEPVENPDKFPFPTLAEFAYSPDQLISFALTCFTLSDELISTIRKQPSNEVANSIDRKLENTNNPEIIDTLLFLCGRALQSDADFLVRKYFDKCISIAFPGLAFATANCLPLAEGYPKITGALALQDEDSRSKMMYTLSWFKTDKTLDWIEQNSTILPFNDDWGRLAAASQFDWQRAVKWLSDGRPLSLFALDALKHCIQYDTSLLKEIHPKLISPPSLNELTLTLENYLAKDNVPRTKRRVVFVLENAALLLK